MLNLRNVSFLGKKKKSFFRYSAVPHLQTAYVWSLRSFLEGLIDSLFLQECRV